MIDRSIALGFQLQTAQEQDREASVARERERMRWIVECGQVKAALAKVQILLFFYFTSQGELC